MFYILFWMALTWASKSLSKNQNPKCIIATRLVKLRAIMEKLIACVSNPADINEKLWRTA